MTELLALPYSPWSEKARWALDARSVPYAYRVYAPILGEPALRWKLRRLRGRVTVPVLTTDDGEALGDSADIARWADARGAGPTLFPPEHAAAIARFVELSERALDAGRALSLSRMLDDADALSEMVPRAVRRALGGAAAARIGAGGIRRTLAKYGGDRASQATHRATLESSLEATREALAAAPAGEPRTLLGRFTFADIAVAQIFAFVEPPSVGLKLGAASRRCFRDAELATRYQDLVAWRDALYAAYRPQGRPAGGRR